MMLESVDGGRVWGGGGGGGVSDFEERRESVVHRRIQGATWLLAGLISGDGNTAPRRHHPRCLSPLVTIVRPLKAC